MKTLKVTGVGFQESNCTYDIPPCLFSEDCELSFVDLGKQHFGKLFSQSDWREEARKASETYKYPLSRSVSTRFYPFKLLDENIQSVAGLENVVLKEFKDSRPCLVKSNPGIYSRLIVRMRIASQ